MIYCWATAIQIVISQERNKGAEGPIHSLNDNYKDKKNASTTALMYNLEQPHYTFIWQL